MTQTTIAILIGLAAAFGSTNAAAQSPQPGDVIGCGQHTALVQALAQRYQERQVSIGLQNNGQLLEVYASGKTGTWTILSTSTDGTSCILAVGQHFEQRALPDAGGSTADQRGDADSATAS